MPDLPDIVHKDAVGIVGVMPQGTSRTGLADGGDASLEVCPARGGERKRAASRGIRELPNLAPLELGADPERVLPNHVADGVSDDIDVLSIHLRVSALTQPGEPGDRDGWAAIFAGGHTAADILQPGFLDPVFAGDRIDLVRKPVGAVISQPDLVDAVGCDQVSVAHADVVAKLGIDDTTLHR